LLGNSQVLEEQKKIISDFIILSIFIFFYLTNFSIKEEEIW